MDETTYILKLNVDVGFNAEQELIDIYRNYFGNDADIRIEYVKDIPQLSSGKRRLTINNYLLEKEYGGTAT